MGSPRSSATDETAAQLHQVRRDCGVVSPIFLEKRSTGFTGQPAHFATSVPNATPKLPDWNGTSMRSSQDKRHCVPHSGPLQNVQDPFE
eukprot:8372611-Pyramimonas_sp.AAC.1